jgi:hypothetical protein
LTRDLERVAGQPGPSAQRRSVDSSQGLNTGVRAFVAREGALIASALERASRALGLDPEDSEAIHNVVRRMQSLRGLAELTDLSPLPEMLEGLETAAAALTRGHAPPPDLSAVFRSAAEAMTRASRDVANQGKPDPEAPETVGFSRTLVEAFGIEADVVDIASLAPAGVDSIERRGEQAAGPGNVATVEIVSQGEHLTAMADKLSSALSDVERQLRTFATLHLLRGLDARLGEPLGSAFQAFAEAAREALLPGANPDSHSTLAKGLKEAGTTLKEVATRDDPSGIAGQVRELGSRWATPAVLPSPDPLEVPGLSVGENADPNLVVSIADLAPDVEPAPPAAAAPPQPGGGGGTLAESFQTYHRLMTEGPGATAPSVGTPAVVQSPAAAASDNIATPGPAPDDDTIVEIEALLYRGDAARERARLLGLEIAECLDRPGIHMGLRPLLEELIDLLPLADQPAAR